MQTPKKDTSARFGVPFFKGKELIAVALVLAAAVAWLLLSRGGRAGAVAVITNGAGEEAQTQTVSLREDGIITVNAALPVTLEVKDGAIRFVHSQCPDHLCEGFGWLSREGETALCAPAMVHVRVEENA